MPRGRAGSFKIINIQGNKATFELKTSSENRISVPAEVRRKIKLEWGTPVRVTLENIDPEFRRL